MRARRGFLALLLVVSVLSMVGCVRAPRDAEDRIEGEVTSGPESANVVGQQTDESSIGEDLRVLYAFARLVNAGQYAEALKELTPELGGAYSMGDNAPLRNIERMEIKRVISKQGIWKGDRTTDTAADVHVYYAEIDYKVRGIIRSYLTNGPYYHKIVLVRQAKCSPWLIQEMSAAPRQP